MIHTVRSFIERKRLLENHGDVIVGLSGGADSVALLALLVKLDYTCVAAHCNFHLRGDESERDALFAKSVADRFGVDFIQKDFDTIAYAKENHLSIEMAARELRYAWFEQIRKERGAEAIAVAHHRDDNTETVLLNLIRGSGIRGMSGMKPKNGYVIRPLLEVSREEILHWLEEQQLSYMEDSTNLSDEYTRNFIRLRLLPLIEEVNVAAKATIARTATHLSEVETIYQSVIEKARKQLINEELRISISELLTFPAPATILYELLKPYGFNRVVSEEVFDSLDKESGKTFYSPAYRLIKDRDYLLLAVTENDETIEKTYSFIPGEESNHLPLELNCDIIVLTKTLQLVKDKQYAYFDFDKLTFPLILRRWNPGDWFIPFGMSGKKKLSDYFADNKYSLLEKEKVWLLCAGADVIWIVGERTDNRFRVGETTKKVLRIKISG
ncbi:tRNA lysidine(34) synthetase TilS [Parabacteroides sp. OttesenSCG-928-G21]|nr:tRNA lysidine(34) synthetase TilS [Parabacteroides sp. OttesenSCG-928-G21]